MERAMPAGTPWHLDDDRLVWFVSSTFVPKLLGNEDTSGVRSGTVGQ